VVQGLRAVIIRGRLPAEALDATTRALGAAGLDQGGGGAAAARGLGDEEVVHHAEAAGVGGGPGPEDRREAHGTTLRVACDELHPLALGVVDERPRKRQ